MTTTVAPSGEDVSGGSSTASTKAPSFGRPSRNDITSALSAKTETPTESPAGDDAGTAVEGPLGAPDGEQHSEGETADVLEAGKGDKKPVEKKEADSVPMAAFKERLAKEKERREKLTADLNAKEIEIAKLRHIVEVSIQENERLLNARREGVAFDERDEELQAVKITQAAQAKIDELTRQHQDRLRSQQVEQQAEMYAAQLRSEISAAVTEFPLVSDAEVIAELRKNPGADVRQVAQAKHEARMAIINKQQAQRAAQAPSTVGKPTGAAKVQFELGHKGITAALQAARAKG